MRAAESGLYEGTRRIKLVEFLIGPHFHIDHGRIGCARYLYHRIAIDCSIGCSRQSVEKSERRYSHQHTGSLGKESLGSGSHTGLLLETESDKTNALLLNQIGGFRDRYAYKAIDILDAYILERACENIHSRHLLRKFWGRFRSTSTRFIICSFHNCHFLGSGAVVPLAANSFI